ncbi:hypothetical protein CDIK_1944 [Cucumispora dikerogammari]|nr:hypothetical protein CDIK_1944 [Cucumispora dikerogammari]
MSNHNSPQENSELNTPTKTIVTFDENNTISGIFSNKSKKNFRIASTMDYIPLNKEIYNSVGLPIGVYVVPFRGVSDFSELGDNIISNSNNKITPSIAPTDPPSLSADKAPSSSIPVSADIGNENDLSVAMSQSANKIADCQGSVTTTNKLTERNKYGTTCTECNAYTSGLYTQYDYINNSFKCHICLHINTKISNNSNEDKINDINTPKNNNNNKLYNENLILIFDLGSITNINNTSNNIINQILTTVSKYITGYITILLVNNNDIIIIKIGELKKRISLKTISISDIKIPLSYSINRKDLRESLNDIFTIISNITTSNKYNNRNIINKDLLNIIIHISNNFIGNRTLLITTSDTIVTTSDIFSDIEEADFYINEFIENNNSFSLLDINLNDESVYIISNSDDITSRDNVFSCDSNTSSGDFMISSSNTTSDDINTGDDIFIWKTNPHRRPYIPSQPVTNNDNNIFLPIQGYTSNTNITNNSIIKLIIETNGLHLTTPSTLLPYNLINTPNSLYNIIKKYIITKTYYNVEITLKYSKNLTKSNIYSNTLLRNGTSTFISCLRTDESFIVSLDLTEATKEDDLSFLQVQVSYLNIISDDIKATSKATGNNIRATSKAINKIKTMNIKFKSTSSLIKIYENLNPFIITMTLFKYLIDDMNINSKITKMENIKQILENTFLTCRRNNILANIDFNKKVNYVFHSKIEKDYTNFSVNLDIGKLIKYINLFQKNVHYINNNWLKLKSIFNTTITNMDLEIDPLLVYFYEWCYDSDNLNSDTGELYCATHIKQRELTGYWICENDIHLLNYSDTILIYIGEAVEKYKFNEIFLTITSKSKGDINNSNIKDTNKANSNLMTTGNIKTLRRRTWEGGALIQLLFELSNNCEMSEYYNNEVKVIKLITKEEFNNCLVEDSLFGVESLLRYFKNVHKLPDSNNDIK